METNLLLKIYNSEKDIDLLNNMFNKILYLGPVNMVLNNNNLKTLDKLLESRISINHISPKKPQIKQYKNYMANDYSYLNPIDSLKSYLGHLKTKYTENDYIIIFHMLLDTELIDNIMSLNIPQLRYVEESN